MKLVNIFFVLGVFFCLASVIHYGLVRDEDGDLVGFEGGPTISSPSSRLIWRLRGIAYSPLGWIGIIFLGAYLYLRFFKDQ